MYNRAEEKMAKLCFLQGPDAGHRFLTHQSGPTDEPATGETDGQPFGSPATLLLIAPPLLIAGF